MVEPNSFRRGLKILYEGAPWEILEYQHIRYAQGNAFVRTRMRNLLNGSVMEKNFKVNENLPEPDLEYKPMQFLYREGERFLFMDLSSYDQIYFSEKDLQEKKEFLKDGMEVDVIFFEGKPITLRLPTHVELRVIKTEPGFKGDTVSGGSKPAILETGLSVQVPLFINEGDLIKVDTRDGSYIERVEG
jgi:elongation factor P